MLRLAVGPDRREQVRLVVLPERLASFGRDADEEFFGAVRVDFAIGHADAAAVERQFLAVGPENLFALRVHRQDCPAETEVGLRIGVVVPLPHSPGPVAEPGRVRGLRVDRHLLGADDGVKDPIDKGHPLPDRTIGLWMVHDDFVERLSGRRVDYLARHVVGQVEDLRRGDHRVAMNHEAFGKRPRPEDRAVVSVDAQQRVELLVLVLLVGDMAAGLEDPPAGGDRHFRHRREHRLGHELGQVRGSGEPIGRKGVVVGRVVGVAPCVRAFRHRLDNLPVANMRDAAGP